jgi:hypothetical protein
MKTDSVQANANVVLKRNSAQLPPANYQLVATVAKV